MDDFYDTVVDFFHAAKVPRLVDDRLYAGSLGLAKLQFHFSIWCLIFGTPVSHDVWSELFLDYNESHLVIFHAV